jgi:hypothetical protein
MKKSKYSGGGDVSFGPDEIVPLIAQQVAWEGVNKHYNSLDPEYKKMLPEPEDPPIYSLTEPMHRYIDENANEEMLNNARDQAKQMSPDEVDDVFTNDNGSMKHLEPIYTKALPSVNKKWVPNMVRADLLRTILN